MNKQRIKPYGPVLPLSPRGHRFADWLKHMRSYMLGVRDGWRQPHSLGSSYNVEHLDDGYGNAYESQDRGINLGQWLRSPINHEQPKDFS